MAGVRIRHVTARNSVYTLVDQRRMYGAPLNCIRCGRVHTFKTYHIALDDVGAAIVSTEVAERISSLGPISGFSVVGDITEPPAQGIGLPGYGARLDLAALPPIVANERLTEPGRG